MQSATMTPTIESNKRDMDEANKEIEAVGGIVAKCESIVVETTEQASGAAEFLKEIKGHAKRMESLRTSMTKPINDSLTILNGMFRPARDNLKTSENILKARIDGFNRKQIELACIEAARNAENARRDEEKKRKQLEAKAEKAKAKGNEEHAEALTQMATDVYVPPKETVYAPVKIAGISTREVYKHQVIDESKVPRSYLIVDEKKLAQIAKTGAKDAMKIPGVRFYPENIISSRAT